MPVPQTTADMVVAAQLTPPGRGAVATVALRGDPAILDGPPALFEAADGRTVAAQPMNRVAFGHWGSDAPEEVVLCRTAMRELEIHCHGGAAAVRRIQNDLAERGCRIIPWQEFARCGQTLIHAECAIAISQAPTLRTARLILEQQSGVLRSAIEKLRGLSLNEVVLCIAEMLLWAGFGRHLTEPWQVVLCGLPNVGKSSLINALLGYSRSIVFDQPGTTRDVVTGQTAFEGWPVELSDTAGLREGADELESEGVARARRRAEEADLIVLVFDRSRPVQAEEHELVERWPQALRVANKCDLPDAWHAARMERVIPVSAVTQSGLDRLMKAVVQRLVPREPPAGTAIPVTARQIAALEEIRRHAAAGDEHATRKAIDDSVA